MVKLDLYCLPFAGGSKYSYKHFKVLNSSKINVVSIDGRSFFYLFSFQFIGTNNYGYTAKVSVVGRCAGLI